MNYTEDAILIPCQAESMVGILAKPEAPLPVGVVVIVGGPQYRAGSHRQFVLLSRWLACNGFTVLRFDYRGMGDSAGEWRDFEAVNADIGATVDALQRVCLEVRRIVLWGLCDGASAALLYCDASADRRISGLCLVNPWVRSAQSLARTQVKHYYRQRLMQKEFWAKLLRGGVAWKALRGLAGNVRAATRPGGAAGTAGASQLMSEAASLPFQERMALAWAGFQGNICLVLSNNDYTAKEFLEYSAQQRSWKRALGDRPPKRYDIDADHTFSGKAGGDALAFATLEWMTRLPAGGSMATSLTVKPG